MNWGWAIALLGLLIVIIPFFTSVPKPIVWIGAGLLLVGIIIGGVMNEKRDKATSSSIVRCASCGTKYTWSRWSRNNGCASCGSNVYSD